jgi:hypothetical protein
MSDDLDDGSELTDDEIDTAWLDIAGMLHELIGGNREDVDVFSAAMGPRGTRAAMGLLLGMSADLMVRLVTAVGMMDAAGDAKWRAVEEAPIEDLVGNEAIQAAAAAHIARFQKKITGLG